MGYKKLSNGEWEQPAQAESRVLRRKIASIVIGGAAVIASAGGAIYGVIETASSNVGQPSEQTDHDKLLAGVLITLFGAAAAAGSGLALGVRVGADNNSLARIRRDIQDEVKIVGGQRVVPDYMTGQHEENPARQPS